MKNVHHVAFAALDEHMENHIGNTVSFKGWAAQGLGLIKDTSCPFCGQGLDDNAKRLITTYQQVFNEKFDGFNRNIKQALDQLRQPFLISDTKEYITQLHQTNLDIVALYHEPGISNHPSFSSFMTSLELRFQELSSSYGVLENNKKAAVGFWLPILNKKYSEPYEAYRFFSSCKYSYSI